MQNTQQRNTYIYIHIYIYRYGIRTRYRYITFAGPEIAISPVLDPEPGPGSIPCARTRCFVSEPWWRRTWGGFATGKVCKTYTNKRSHFYKLFLSDQRFPLRCPMLPPPPPCAAAGPSLFLAPRRRRWPKDAQGGAGAPPLDSYAFKSSFSDDLRRTIYHVKCTYELHNHISKTSVTYIV